MLGNQEGGQTLFQTTVDEMNKVGTQLHKNDVHTAKMPVKCLPASYFDKPTL